MVDNRHVVGYNGERRAELFLKNNKYTIIDRNWRYKNHHEIDLIATRGNVLMAVEVRSLSDSKKLKPFETINVNKIRRIKAALLIYAQLNNIETYHLQVDAISVSMDTGEINHFEAIDLNI